jgi:nitrogen PTS system EIIA component
MEAMLDLYEMLRLGGVYQNISGKTPAELYHSLSTMISLPQGISPEILADELSKRDAVLSTAVGNGIAIPHALHPIVKDFNDQRIIVCYPREPVDMDAPDSRNVYVLFVLLTAGVQSHLQIISRLAGLFHKNDFRKLLEAHADAHELLEEIRRYDLQ